MRRGPLGQSSTARSGGTLGAIGLALLLIASTAWMLAIRTNPPPPPPRLHEMTRTVGWRALPWREQNEKRITSLKNCLSARNCRERQEQVVILVSYHFVYALQGSTSGENIWANSMFDSVEDLGYTYLIGESYEDLVPLYNQYPSRVKVVITMMDWVPKCLHDEQCIRSDKFPQGIPLWQMIVFEWWRGAHHPLGHAWTLSPEDWEDGDVYLGYSVQRSCYKNQYIPHAKRKNRAVVLAKRVTYFYKPSYPWLGVDYANPPATAAAALGEGFEFVGAARNDTAYGWDNGDNRVDNPVVPAGINPLTQGEGENLSKEQWFLELADTRVMVGIGQPYVSPSPWDALCLGVPFINPVMVWDRSNPENRSAWTTQHDGLRYEPEPRVYHILEVEDMAERTKMFWEAVTRAMTTPIERYIAPSRTPDAVRERFYHIVMADWRQKAVEWRQERISKGEEVIEFDF
ncbi:hypothetical protein BKA62DRAFT_390017 [Auriculariales sp. MPI-PUGE-AT-0066]|nr:hypothetical protein BKA62DRAFT_390017 [Auriculariales sp. MPI-PUGE-AT-0066]